MEVMRKEPKMLQEAVEAQDEFYYTPIPMAWVGLWSLEPP